MAEWINVGAYIGDDRAASKAALKRALASAPHTVTFDATSELSAGPAGYRGDDVPAGVNLSVVGPDPYTSRKYYATVTRKADGTPKLV
jgi:hypothetical protein